jgi:toxin CptA
MPHSIRSSNASAPCRIEWSPSRWVVIALHSMGVLAAFSVLMSEMPPVLAWPLAVGAMAQGIRLGRSESRQPKRELVWPHGGSPMIDGQPMAEAVLGWRGPLAFLRWRDPDGRTQRLSWWPDVLSAAARRELRLAALDGAGAAPAASMAP